MRGILRWGSVFAALLAFVCARPASIAAESAPVVINDGDSLLATDGSPETGATSLLFALRALDDGAEGVDIAISGVTLAQMVANFRDHTAPRIPGGRPVALHVLSGANDLRRGATADAVFAALRAYVALAKPLGVKILVSSYPLQCDILKNHDLNAALKRYNDLVYASWSRPLNQGGLEADGLVDYFADPVIGPGTYDHSAYCDPRRSRDGAHFGDEGKKTMGEIEARAVRAVMSKGQR